MAWDLIINQSKAEVYDSKTDGIKGVCTSNLKWKW